MICLKGRLGNFVRFAGLLPQSVRTQTVPESYAIVAAPQPHGALLGAAQPPAAPMPGGAQPLAAPMPGAAWPSAAPMPGAAPPLPLGPLPMEEDEEQELQPGDGSLL